MPNADESRIVVQCTCGARLKVSAKTAGRTGKCPKCNQKFTVPLPPASDTPAAAPEPPAASGGDWLDELAANEQGASVAADQPLRPEPGGALLPCPKCSAPLATGAVICTSCGYNAKTGRKTKGASLAPGAVEVATKAAKTAGSFVLGCILAAVGAGIGAGVWYFIAVKAGHEVGYIAWGLGLITGFGMAVGSRMGGNVPGVVAAAIAVAGIAAAKCFVAAFVIYAVASGDTDNTELKKAFVILHMVPELLMEQGIDPDEATKQQWDMAADDAAQTVEAMSRNELDEARAHYKLVEARMAEDAATSDQEADDGVFAEVFWAMFGLMDVVFILLAIASAYKVGFAGLSFGPFGSD